MRTEQGKDEPASLFHDEDQSTRIHAQTAVMSPTPAGTPITLEGETLEELRRDLIGSGFSASEADEIIAKYSIT